MRHLIGFAVGVVAIMISVYVFAPSSENKVLRAIVVSIAMRVGFIAALLLGGVLVNPLIGLVAACLAPLLVLKFWYGISLWRAAVIIIFVGVVSFFLDGLVAKLDAPAPPPPPTIQTLSHGRGWPEAG